MSSNLNSLLGVQTAQAKSYSSLSQDEKIIETARVRTNAFTKAIDAYYKDAFDLNTENIEGTGLPSWNSINTGTQNFVNQVKAFGDFIDPRPDDVLALERTDIPADARRSFLEETSVYPGKTFPYLKGYGQDMTLYELLRRRPDLGVTAWELRMQAVGKELEEGVVVEGGKRAVEQDWVELWNDAAIVGMEMMQAQMDEGEDFEEDEDEEEEGDGDQVMTDAKGKGVESAAAGPAMPLEYVLAYVSSGYVPPPPPPRDVKGGR
jgi:hypothetical protein